MFWSPSQLRPARAQHRILRSMLFAALTSSCLPATTEQAFIASRDEVFCDEVYPFCSGKYAGCTLNEEQYVGGTFPGSRKLLVETREGDFNIRVLIFLDEQRYPGTETEINWYEPGCSDSYRFQLTEEAGNSDIFAQAGRDHIFEVEHPVTDPGDHLVEVFSDATARYLLRIEIVPR